MQIITSVQYIQSKPLKLNPIKSINETDLTIELQGWKVKLSVTDVKEFDAWKPKYKTIRLSFPTIDAICLYFAVILAKLDLIAIHYTLWMK